jgi:hypothetical protein
MIKGITIQDYDKRQVHAIIGTSTGTIFGPVPEHMVGVILNAEVTNPGTTNVILTLAQQRMGTITGTLSRFGVQISAIGQSNRQADALLISQQEATWKTVDPGHYLVGVTTAGSVEVSVQYTYIYGRSLRP